MKSYIVVYPVPNIAKFSIIPTCFFTFSPEWAILDIMLGYRLP
jgi:hypothetical protein